MLEQLWGSRVLGLCQGAGEKGGFLRRDHFHPLPRWLGARKFVLGTPKGGHMHGVEAVHDFLFVHLLVFFLVLRFEHRALSLLGRRYIS